MDESTLAAYILRCRLLQSRFIGVFPADLYPCPLPTNTFAIINTSPSTQEGQHWVVLANRDGCHIFADPLGKRLPEYHQIYWRLVSSLNIVVDLIKTPLQPPMSKLCGLWCLFLAHKIFDSQLPIQVPVIDEVELLRFVKHVFE